MKMETVIRSPQDGVIKKLAHKEGVSQFANIYLPLGAHLANCFLRTFAKQEPFLSCLRRNLAKRNYHNGIMKAFVLREAL
jgi:hypothetical protein